MRESGDSDSLLAQRIGDTASLFATNVALSAADLARGLSEGVAVAALVLLLRYFESFRGKGGGLLRSLISRTDVTRYSYASTIDNLEPMSECRL